MSVWDQLVGQEQQVQVLQKAASAARQIVCQRGSGNDDTGRQMSHAWLITGPPGSGRSLAAKAFAASLQCEGETVGCGKCQGCTQTMGGTHPDVRYLRTEKVVISIEEARQLIGVAAQAPSQGKWRVIVVEDADRMVERTSNVLLKAIEEPPPHTVWLLCAPSPEDMITTIRSRCRALNLRVPPVRAVAELIVARDGVDPQVAMSAARAAQSHIGLAKYLATDPQARKQRRKTLLRPAQVRSVADAVFAAGQMVDLAKAEAERITATKDAAELGELKRALGLDADAKVPPALRAQVRQLEEEQKRRATRALRDQLDRAMTDLMSLYRDVYARQVGADVDFVNDDMVEVISDLASQMDTAATIAKMDAIEVARRRLAHNVTPVVAIEAMCVALRPHAQPTPWE